jgi:hypothetical protein
MPARGRRDKKSGSQNRNPAGGPAGRPAGAPRSVAELLTRGRAAALLPRKPQAFDWKEFIKQNLGPDLAPRVTSVELRRAGLIVMTDSAVWSARLRFALGEATPEIRRLKPEVSRIEVRVALGRSQPRSAGGSPADNSS